MNISRCYKKSRNLQAKWPRLSMISEKALLAGKNHSKVQQPLTFWKAKDRHYQQARVAARHQSHSPSEKSRTNIISWLELQQGTTVAHSLKSQGQAWSAKNVARDHGHSHPREPRQAWSAGENCSKVQQPLTSWKVKGRDHQQTKIAAKHHSYSLSGEPRTGMISRLELQQGTKATHPLESQGQE